MGKFDGILLCTDFDGTFAMSGTRISRENCDAVRYFQKNGGLFTIATGRSPEFILGFDEFALNAPIIAANGTMICDCKSGERLMTFPMRPEIVSVMEMAVAQPFAESVYICSSDGHGKKWSRDSGVSVTDFFGNVPMPWYKVIFEQSVENTAAMEKWAADNYTGIYEFGRSYRCGLEFQEPGTGKGEGMERVKSMLGGIRLTVGAGDYENDVSLIRRADIGYAVANAVTEAKRAADRITVSNDEHAIAHIISELEKSVNLDYSE